MNLDRRRIKSEALSIYNSLLPFNIRSAIYQNTKLNVYKKNANSNNGDEIIKSFNRHKCIFVHIPKTGGISIKKSLFNCYSPLPHFGVKEYKLIFGAERFEQYFKFAVVRNPWSRLLSAYLFLKQGGCTKRDALWSEKHLAKYDSFNDFVIGWLNKKNIYSRDHFIPQSYFLCDREGKLSTDYVARLEQLEYEFDYLRMKVNPDAQLQHLNKNSNKKVGYQQYYTPEAREIVEHLYRDDIDLLEYKFV